MLLAACAKDVDRGSVERQIAAQFARQTGGRVPVVTCPRGQPAQRATTFVCTVGAGGVIRRVRVTLRTDTTFTFALLRR